MTCEPCTYLLEPEADSLQTSFSDTIQLSLLSGNPTPAKSCENAPQMDGSPACTCGRETFGCSIHPSTPEAWIASMRDSLALIFHSLESKPGLATALGQVFTEKSCASLTSLDPDTCSWKTSQQSFLMGSEPFSQTWPRAGMTCGGHAFELPMLEQIIGEIDGGRLPQWQTPVADDAVNRTVGKFNSRGEPKLSAQVMMWPTPTLCGNHNRKGLSKKSGDGLATAVANSVDMSLIQSCSENMAAQIAKAKALKVPTPSSNDWKGSSKPGQRRGQLTDPAMGAIPAGGKLNPAWVEWLMGWPLGHTNSKSWVTVKCRSKLQSHGDCLGVSK